MSRETREAARCPVQRPSAPQEKLLRRGLFMAGCFALAASIHGAALGAVLTGDAAEYKVTIKGVSLCTDASCSIRYGLGGGASRTFDIASVSVGAAAGVFARLRGIPIGTTVTHVFVSMGRAFSVTGSVDVGGGTTCYTDGTQTTGSILSPSLGKTTAPATSQALFVPNAGIFGGEPSEATFAAAGVTLVDDTTLSAVVALASPYTVTSGAPTIEIAFSTRDSVGAVFSGTTCIMLVQAPSVRISLR